MIAESETFFPDKSMLIGKTIEQLEKQYKIKVLPTSFFLDPKTTIHVEGEWDNVAKFEKDLFTLKTKK
jgi:hypothetical protein